MRIAVGLHGDQIAVFLEVQSEFAVKGLRDRKVGDGEMKSVDGMNAELARTPGRPDETLYSGHSASSRSPLWREPKPPVAKGTLRQCYLRIAPAAIPLPTRTDARHRRCSVALQIG